MSAEFNAKVESTFDAIRAALIAEFNSGIATGRYTYDHHSDDAELRETMRDRHKESSEAAIAMWRDLYDLLAETSAAAETPSVPDNDYSITFKY